MNTKTSICTVSLALLGVATASANPVFVDVTGDAGLSMLQGDGLTGERIMTGGAACADIDDDGWPDLLVTRYDGSPYLFKNLGDGTFEDRSAGSGIVMSQGSNAAGWADVDNDGDSDLYITQSDRRGGGGFRHRLFINDGSGAFSDQALIRGASLGNRPKFGTSVAFGDYDLDGWLDIHVCEWGLAGSSTEGATALLRNRGEAAPGTFANVTSEAGVSVDDVVGFGYVLGDMPGNWTFSSRFTDLDGDGLPDLVTAGDFNTSRLFWNEGDGTFIDGTASAMVGTDENGMGMAVADYDRDGRTDIFITSIFHVDPPLVGDNVDQNWGTSGNRLYRNIGGRVFEDTTTAAGVRDGGWGWGTSFGDFDQDGWLDLVMTNGYSLSPVYEADQSHFFRNLGDGSFEDISDDVGVTDTLSGKGLLTFDYDNDGDLDVFIVNNSAGPILYRNDQTAGNDWLKLRLRGTVSNRDGIGARVVVELPDGGGALAREVDGGSNYLAQSDRVVHFGLGDLASPLPSVTITWPSGLVQQFSNIEPNQTLEIVEADSQKFSISDISRTGTGELSVTWWSQPGRRYVVEKSDDLRTWGSAISPSILATGNQTVATLGLQGASATLRVRELP